MLNKLKLTTPTNTTNVPCFSLSVFFSLFCDTGEPPATGTGTLVVHLGDKNDNKPHLIANISVMCGNKVDRVRVIANDADVFPFSGPFTFTLSPEDQKLKSLWKLETNLGE